MASEATTAALERSAVDADDIGAVFAASVSDYFAEHGVAAQLAYRLGAPTDSRTGDFRGTARAAADALETARQYVRATEKPVVVAAADIMPVEPGATTRRQWEPAPGRSSFGHVATIQPRRSIRWDRQRLAFSSGTANTASPPNRGSPVRASTRRPTGRDDGARTNRNRRRSRVCSRQCTGVSVRSNGASVHRRGTTLDVQRRRVRRHGDVVAGHRTRAGIDRSGDSLVAIAYGQGGADAFRLTVTDATDERPGLSVSTRSKRRSMYHT